jgi:hypothetical protein
MPTLLEIAQGRQIPLTAGIIEAAATKAPALMVFDARTTSSTRFMALALTGLPTASGFKDYGEGFTHGSASLSVREFEAKLAGAKVEVEQITAARWDAEHASSGTTYFDLQVMARMSAEMRHLERVIFYGTAQDAKGFPGLKQLTPYTNVLTLTEDPGATDFAKTVINAGGTTSSTASSVYSVVHGPLDCQLVVCNDGGGELFTMTEPLRQHIAPNSSAPTATLEHLVTQIHGHFGVSVSGMNETPNAVVPTQYSVRRLANLTEDSGKGVDDAKLEQLVLSHGDDLVPSRLYMNGRSARQWATSRSASTATLFLGMSGDAKNNTGSLRAARPDNFEGIPVTYTSAIASTDAINS